MKILVSVFLFSLCTAVLSDVTPETKTTIAPEQNTTTSTSPETTTVVITTVVPTTTNAPTTTEVPTTEVPTTTPSPKPSPSPITTTPSPKPSPSPITSTTPPPEPCSWNVTEKGVTCIRVELLAKFIIPIEGKDRQLALRCDASTHKSDCSSNETQTLVLTDYDYEFTMIFAKEDDKIYVRNTSLEYSLTGGAGKVANNSDNVFKVKAGNSYLCKSEFAVQLENVTMQVDKIHIQAFAEDKDFGAAEECPADDKVSDIVPIAVGVALGALIIIVLIAYLVGRRRSRQKGYQSV